MGQKYVLFYRKLIVHFVPITTQAIVIVRQLECVPNRCHLTKYNGGGGGRSELQD